MNKKPVTVKGKIDVMTIKRARDLTSTKSVKTVLCLSGGNKYDGAVADLCGKPSAVLKLIRDSKKIAQKVEIPCLDETVTVEYRLKKKTSPVVVATEEATLGKIVLKPAEENNPRLELHYTEQSTKKLTMFLYDNLSEEIIVTFTQEQAELFVEEKK